MISRRNFLLAAPLLAAPFVSRAQQPARPASIGFLYFASRRSAIESRRYPSFIAGMADLGYVEGRNLVIEARFADGKAERLPSLADELVDAKVDVIIAGGNPAINAARRATSTIPIVIAQSPDPVAQGWASSLARPGGNVTGLITVASEIELKMVEYLRAVAPRLARLAVLSNPTNRSHGERVQVIRGAAGRFGASVLAVAAQTPDQLESAFKEMTAKGAQALIVLGDTYFLSRARNIAGLALANRLPSAHTIGDYAEAGGLIAFGPDIADNFRRAAGHVDKILKGAKPGDLPIEQPTRFELVINLKTARALKLSIPQALMLQADRLIE